VKGENLKLTSKFVCAQSVKKIITVRNLNNTRIFVNEVKTQYKKNHSGAANPRISTIQKTRLVTK
jgi:5-bromo-4-chloroindolyl phosphate hydrolysis protein